MIRWQGAPRPRPSTTATLTRSRPLLTSCWPTLRPGATATDRSFLSLRVPAYRPGRISWAILHLKLDGMGDVLTFTLRPKPVAPAIPTPFAGSALRASLEEAAQTALDAADCIIAVLDSLDGSRPRGRRGR